MENRILNDFKDLFASARSYLEREGSLMSDARKESFEDFVRSGGIKEKTEAYRYLKLLPVFSQDYHIMFDRALPDTGIEDLFKCAVHGMISCPVVSVNGWYHPDNNTRQLPEGVVCCSMREAELHHRDLFSKYYGKYANVEYKDPAVALNGAFAQDGIFIYVPEDTVVEVPVQVINLLQSVKPLMAYQRNLIIVGSGAKLSVLVCDHTLSDSRFLLNSVTEMAVSENARVDYVQVQSQGNETSQINSLYTEQAAYSHVCTNVLSLYGRLIRNNLISHLNGVEACTDLFGCYIIGGRQCVDNFTYLDHARPSCTSNELFKGVMDGSSVGNFTGCIQVRPDAQKTEAYQGNSNLLLTDTARINTKPRLIIDADDVKCSHGATIGQIDEEAMFYLRSRGIGVEEARMMMMAGFAHDIIRRINNEPLRNKVAAMVERRLRGEKNPCGNCRTACRKYND